MKVKLEATIPTTQYGNLRPTFELEDDGDEEQALTQLQSLWSRFGETPLKEKGSDGVAIETFTGETLMWDEQNHIYKDLNGNVMLSGSKYADQHSPKFDMATILPKTAKAWEVKEGHLKDLWEMNGNMANHWGSALHLAMEIYHKYGEIGEKIKESKGLDDNYALPKQEYLKKAVSSFVEQYGADALPEVVVSDIENKMAGTIDRLAITGDMKCRIGDYKTNAEMDKKKLDKYQLQLSFYAQILKNHGWEVEGLDLYHYGEDGWHLEQLEILPLDKK